MEWYEMSQRPKFSAASPTPENREKSGSQQPNAGSPPQSSAKSPPKAPSKSSRLTPWLVPILSSLSMLLAFFLAPRFPALETTLSPYAKYNLSVLLLINALHINYRSLSAALLRKPLLLGYGVLVNNVLLPLVAFALCSLLWPAVVPAAILLAGISSGFSTVSFAILMRLVPELNLLLTLGSSFVVPFSLPFLLYFLASSSVEMDLLGMMLQTAWMVFVPILLERILFFSSRKLHAWLKEHTQSVVAIILSGTAFILMLSGQGILRRQASDFWFILLFSICMAALIYFFTLIFFWRATLETQLIMLISTMVANTGMASVLALDYLDGTTLAITIVFSILWNFNIVFLRAWPPLRRSFGHTLRRALGKDKPENLL